MAAKASECSVVAAGHLLMNKSFAKGTIDILDRVSLPKFFAQGEDKPGRYRRLLLQAGQAQVRRAHLIRG